MKIRLLKKGVSTIYNAATKGNLRLAYDKLERFSPEKQRKILNIFNEQAFKKLGAENGADVVVNFAGYRGFQQGLKTVGGTKGIAEQVSQIMKQHLDTIIQDASKKALNELPQTSLGWIKLELKEN